MLKKYPQDYQLWIAYAQIDIQAGRLADGLHVYSTALSFVDFSKLDAKQTGYVDMLFLSYIIFPALNTIVDTRNLSFRVVTLIGH